MFKVGDQPSLGQVLENRESRSHFHQQLSQKFPNNTIISFQLNIPGPVKNNASILSVFHQGIKLIDVAIAKAELTPVYFKEINQITGPEAFYVVSTDLKTVKTIMLSIEEDDHLGRLFDIDVLAWDLNSLSRQDLGFPPRTCFVCSMDAKICGRNRTHTLDELLAHIEQIILTDSRLN